MGHLRSSQPTHDHQDWGPRWGHISGEGTSSSTHSQGLGSILTAPFRGGGGVEGQLGPLDQSQDSGWALSGSSQCRRDSQQSDWSGQSWGTSSPSMQTVR
ncbi:unnamed protein product [Rangifer tarandus platyrhynchus]|uniref:Uncharacterized protein n=2 Tax=Rangifer tarandus platyrhynchus TaxID=3082113 RepID=A0AC59Z9Y4_RANTA|nr:unnamed protein product [Rangifer tarandus platyrhynchus]